MSDADSELWSQFLDQEGLDGTQFTYDVALGSKKAEAPAGDERGQRLYRALFAKRADAVRFTDEATELYEVKPQADLRVLGQLLVYADLIATKLRPDRPVEMHLVTRELDPDIEPSLSLRGIHIHLVGGQPSSRLPQHVVVEPPVGASSRREEQPPAPPELNHSTTPDPEVSPLDSLSLR